MFFPLLTFPIFKHCAYILAKQFCFRVLLLTKGLGFIVTTGVINILYNLNFSDWCINQLLRLKTNLQNFIKGKVCFVPSYYSLKLEPMYWEVETALKTSWVCTYNVQYSINHNLCSF